VAVKGANRLSVERAMLCISRLEVYERHGTMRQSWAEDSYHFSVSLDFLARTPSPLCLREISLKFTINKETLRRIVDVKLTLWL
jgi:hypothetical protein